MDIDQIPPVQPNTNSNPNRGGDAKPSVMKIPGSGSGGSSVQTLYDVKQAKNAEQIVAAKKDNSNLFKMIALIILSLSTVTFVGLFVWMYSKYTDLNTDFEAQVDAKVSEAETNQKLKDEEEFAEREKNPYRSFSGPSDYGQLSFEYPKTWSLYIARDAANGGDYEAYFNPIQVETVSKDTINALRVSILDKSFESVVSEYQRFLNSPEYDLQVSAITVNNVTANKYVGTIPNTTLNGVIVMFKIRDKTAILRTDSMLFREDFDKLIETVKFNA